jgi:hypothetical protein
LRVAAAGFFFGAAFAGLAFFFAFFFFGLPIACRLSISAIARSVSASASSTRAATASDSLLSAYSKNASVRVLRSVPLIPRLTRRHSGTRSAGRLDSTSLSLSVTEAIPRGRVRALARWPATIVRMLRW